MGSEMNFEHPVWKDSGQKHRMVSPQFYVTHNVDAQPECVQSCDTAMEGLR